MLSSEKTQAKGDTVGGAIQGVKSGPENISGKEVLETRI